MFIFKTNHRFILEPKPKINYQYLFSAKHVIPFKKLVKLMTAAAFFNIIYMLRMFKFIFIKLRISLWQTWRFIFNLRKYIWSHYELTVQKFPPFNVSCIHRWNGRLWNDLVYIYLEKYCTSRRHFLYIYWFWRTLLYVMQDRAFTWWQSRKEKL